MPVRSVTLWMLGGATALGGDAPTPQAEIAIAAAGPATTLVIAGLAAIGAWLMPAGLITAALSWLAVMSLVLAVFNLLPAAPLDGGRVLRGIVWWRVRDRDRATTVAASAGRALGVVLIALGAFETLAGYLGGLWLVLLGWFIRSGAVAEQVVGRTNRLANFPVERAMVPTGELVPQWWTVTQVVSRLAPARPGQRFIVVVDLDGTVRGVVTPHDLARVPAARRDELRIADLARITRPAVVEIGTPLASVAPRVQAGRPAVVVDERQRPVGIVTAADIDVVATLTDLGVCDTVDDTGTS
jgi:CBS domain-containing protein